MPSIASPRSTRRDFDDLIERGVHLHGEALAALDDGDLDRALAGEALPTSKASPIATA